MACKGWCSAHYTRWRRHGDPLGGGISHIKDRRCKNHPDRRARGFGLCGSCVHRHRSERTEKRCKNHPERPVYAREICTSCYQHEMRIRNTYGLTVAEYQELMSQPCGICGSDKVEALDHCHDTNRVRGGLCTRCNVGLGVVETWYLKNREKIDAWIAFRLAV